MAEKDGRIRRSIRYIKTGAVKGAEKARELTHRDKAWEGLDRLPQDHAGPIITDGCAVLEGGSFRGMFTSGVLDVFMEHGLNFQTAVGTSAGALNGVNYIAGEIGRSARINLGYRHDSRYMGMSAVAHGQCVLGLKFIVEDVCRELPLDFERLNDPQRRLIVTATDINTGKVIYFEKGHCTEFMKAVRSSATMPYISLPVWVEGHPCLDGGCAVKIPFEWALNEGFKKIVVIRTRPWGERRDPATERQKENALRFYKDYPQLVELLNTQAENYNAECEALERLHQEGRIYMLCPHEPITTATIEGNLDKLADTYYMGRTDAEEKIGEIFDYLKR